MIRVEIYTKKNCPYCTAAKILLGDKNVTFEEHDAEFDEELRAEMIERSGGRTTFPEIFINNNHIGGFDDLSKLDQEGKLDDLLNQNHL